MTINPLWSVLIMKDPADDVTLEHVDIVWVNHASAYERFNVAIDMALARWGGKRTQIRAFPFLHDDISKRQLSWWNADDAVPHVWLEKYK